MKELSSILRDAITDFAAHAAEQTPSEWLQSYLGEKLPGRSADAIRAISGEVLETLDLMEQKQAAMSAALESGQSAESWLTADILQDSASSGSTARIAAEFLQGIGSVHGEVIEADFVEDEAEWNDEEWNDYKLKDTLRGVAAEAGQAGLREIASDVFLQASQEGIASLADGEFLADTVVNAAGSGLKVAVSAGLAVAEESGIIPHASFKVLAATAHRAVESFTVFRDVLKGKKTITEALIHVKDTAVATFSAMWQQHKDEVCGEIVDAVGTVFGMKGAVVAGVVNGLLAPPREESRVVTVLKEVGKAAWSFLTKERHIPALSRLKEKLFNRN